MKKLTFPKKENDNKTKNKIALRGGSYSLLLIGIVLAILIVANVFVSILPATVTKIDISAAKLYSVTSNTKAVVNALDEDVTIYWIVQADEEDSIIENLLSKYDSMSDHITVIKRNPDVYPTFAAQYTDETVENNSLVVESKEKSRFISYSDIYTYELDMDTYSYAFYYDGEGCITSAIDYVVSDDLPQLYALKGHGEDDFSETFNGQIEKDNIEVTSFSLLTENEVPEDADCVIIYAPSSDISEEEKDLLAEYVENGGKLMVLAGPTEDGTLKNLYSLLENYGFETVDGVVIEEDMSYYAFQVPYILLPEVASSDITDELIEDNYYVLAPIAQGLIVPDSSSATVTELLNTSDTAFSKADGYALTTYEKEDGDTDGPFSLAVYIENANEGGIVWISSSYFLDDTYNSYSSGANLDFAMNALSKLIGERENISIRSKSLNYNYLTISTSTSQQLEVVMIAAIPLAFIAIGICVLVVRRRLK